MALNEISLKGFGIHKDLTVKFQRGINAIIGRNRKGKTNIMESICFGLYGKTQNSTLDKVINFEMEKATVCVKSDDLTLTRTRTKQQSRLEGIEKLELDTKLNLSYQEFLSIFYISSHEQKSLFEASYFRNFLISLFNLEIYSKIYDRLGAEYQGLQAATINIKKVNLPLIKSRYTRVQTVVQKLSAERQKYDGIIEKYRQALNQLEGKSGEVRSQWNVVVKKQTLLAQQKCTECGQPITDDYKRNVSDRIHAVKEKIQAVNKQIEAKKVEVNKGYADLNKKVSALDNRIYKGRTILTVLQEKAKQQTPVINVQRIKELEQLMPAFSPQGFPSYLLQVYVPVIVTTANNLLQIMFPDMRVSIRTEKPESNRPDFKVLIHKGEEIQEINDLCGAERVLVNLCFRLGIMVIFKQLSQTKIDFMMCDEGMEKLDDYTSIEVLKLFQNFITMGYLNQVILVTHKDILKKQECINYIEL